MQEAIDIGSPNIIWCLFCDKPGDLVKEPNPEMYLTIKGAADKRQDEIRDKFYILYNPDFTKQSFSWHKDCMTSYVKYKRPRVKEDVAESSVAKRQSKPGRRKIN